MSNTSETIQPVDPSAHNAEMVAKADASGAQFTSGKAQPGLDAEMPVGDAAPAAPAADGRPANVPEKFWNAETKTVNTEALLASYATLEASRGQPADPAPAEPAAGDEPAGDPPAADTAVARAQAEFEANGDLSEESYAALEAEGIDRPTVEAYVRGIESSRLLAHTAAGGEEQYTAMIEWAGKNLSADEIAAYDAATEGSPRDLVAAVQGLSERFAAGRRNEPALLAGGETPLASNDGFKSKAEMVAAMSDPRYRSDEAYRSDVARRMAASMAVGINPTM